MSFHVGQRVVCVDMSLREKWITPVSHVLAATVPLVVPAEGYVYTVRAVLDARPYGFDGDALLLEEVVNPVMAHTTAPVAGAVFEVEVFFLAWRFRPLYDTNIEVFTRMLEPVPQEPAELADA
jgi:hypothetical protein